MRKSIICRSYSCSGAPVIHAGHVGNVLWPSIAFRQWLGSEYPQITSEREKTKKTADFTLVSSPDMGTVARQMAPLPKKSKLFFSL